MQAITEEMGIHKDWIKEAKQMTLDKLPAFLDKLINDYRHDYGTIVHATAAAMVAVQRVIDSSPQGGITGFQAGCLAWIMLREYGSYGDGPLKVIPLQDYILYPQYHGRHMEISKESFGAIQDVAKKQLAKWEEQGYEFVHSDVRDRYEMVASGTVPPLWVLEED